MKHSFISIVLFLAANLFCITFCSAHSSDQSSQTDCTSGFCQLTLSDELLKKYKVTVPADNNDNDCPDCKITVQLELDGYSWIGFGVSGSNGGMVGSHVIIGEPGLSEPKAYYLNGKDQSLITKSDIVLEDATIDFINGQTVMEFTTTFQSLGIGSPIDEEPSGISLSGTSSFTWAHGNDGQNELAYHGSNKAVYVLDGLLTGAANNAKATKISMSENITPYKSKWIVHGILAFISWGICAPVAITSAIYRDFGNKYLSKWWFYVHVGCNSINYFFTFVVFVLAVSTIKKEGSLHWGHDHNKMGLAIFLLSTFQVVGGVTRPKTNNDNEKTLMRKRWELAHRIFGLLLFLFGVWQIYAGMVLYNMRYGDSTFSINMLLYIIWSGLWTGLIAGGTAYKWVNCKSTTEQQKESDNDGDNQETESAPEKGDANAVEG